MVKRISLVEEVINIFLNDIKVGHFSYGEKLPSQEKMSEKYNVSRLVIREALNRLSAIGMITFKQGKGTYLNESYNNSFIESDFSNLIFQNADNLKEVLEARQIIERETSYLAAKRRDIESLQKIKENLLKMEENKNDITNFANWDLEFHVSIAAASQNSVLQKILILLKDGYWSDIGKFFEIEGVIEKTLEEHNNIYLQIEQGNSVLASQLMTEHLTYPDKVIAKSLNAKDIKLP